MTVQPRDIQEKSPSGSSPAAEKVCIRRRFLTRRAALTPEAAGALSQAIHTRFWRLRAAREMEVRRCDGQGVWLSCYLDFDREVQTRPIVRKALALGYRVAVPVVLPGREGTLILSEIMDVPSLEEPGPGWVRSRFGLLEPRAPRPVEPERMDCFVVPGVAFDRRGYRVGFGKGYYDKLLASARPDAWRIGLAFSAQMTPRLPREAWDVPLHRVVTEGGVVQCRRPPSGPAPWRKPLNHPGGE